MPLMSKPMVSHAVRGYHNQIEQFTIYACPDCLFRVGSLGDVKKRTLLVAINKHEKECWLFRLSLAVQNKII